MLCRNLAAKRRIVRRRHDPCSTRCVSKRRPSNPSQWLDRHGQRQCIQLRLQNASGRLQFRPIHRWRLGYPGMLAACEQFGAAVCNHNVSSLSSSGGCGSYTDGTGHTGGQTICSWGKAADKQAANQNCSTNGVAPTPPTTPKKINCPTPGGGAPGTAIPPTPASAPVSLPASLA